MNRTEFPRRHEETVVRQLVRRAERVRYWWEYRGRLKQLLGVIDPTGDVRLTAGEHRVVRDFWAGYGIRYVNPDWYRLFKALTGTVNPQYIPEETFRVRLEPLLCRRDVSAAYHDKNQLDRLFADVARPTTVLRNIYGAYFDAEYRPIDRASALRTLASLAGPHFLKPAISGTGSGMNVAKFEYRDGAFRVGGSQMTLEQIEQIYVQDFVIQAAVVQHSALAAFHPESLNTVRLITLRFGGECTPIAATLRMGNGSHVDNGHAGGLLCGIDLISGRLTPTACDVSFRPFDRHPRSSVMFAGQTVPSFAEVQATGLAVHQRLPHFDMISCDLAVLANGSPCLIEVNTFGQGIEPHQYLKGQPLFGERTREVLALVAERDRSGWNR